jgi:inhibitor of KinA
MTTRHMYHIYPCGDHAVTIELGDAIDITINQKIIFLFRYLKELNIYGVRDVIPAYHTLTLVYDLALLKKQNPKASVYDEMKAHLQKAFDLMKETPAVTTKLVEIPVCYDPSLAPDIVSLAAEHKLSVEEVVKLHTEKTYRVYMTGFLPGFAYMGTVDAKINTPRKQQPRTMVPAGSVGIAGEQTGIYPFDSPGGWQLIGQTPVVMFDARREEPCFLRAGDEVRFHPVTLNEFNKLKRS